MRSTPLLTIAAAVLLSLGTATVADARGGHGSFRGLRHGSHANHFRAVRFRGKVVERWPTEEERLRSSPATVAAVQRSLRVQGAYSGPIDGQLTSRTRQAISRFQGSAGIRNTGTLDGILIAALGLDGSIAVPPPR